VKWTRGDQSGLQFKELFDIHLLSKTRPEIASTTGGRETLGNAATGAWHRASIEEMARLLGG
jgi:hypothetical protein